MKFFHFFACMLMVTSIAAQSSTTQRSIRYKPVGNDFTIENGDKKFNRALYGTNTAFRVEAGDLPEFALYLPGVGGNCKIGITTGGGQSKWLTSAAVIKATYRPGSMLYTISDPLLGKGNVQLSVLPLAKEEGMIIKVQPVNIASGITVTVIYGGVTGKKLSRDGDIGADPESSFYLKTEYCKDNTVALNKNNFQLNYTTSNKGTTTINSLSGVFPVSAITYVGNAAFQEAPIFVASAQKQQPQKDLEIVAAEWKLTNQPTYFVIKKGAHLGKLNYNGLAKDFTDAETSRKQIANRITINTPDKFINPVAGALAIAADGIWEDPTFLHGAVAWRMRLNAWRGAYAADPLGWHNRAKMHFSSYGLSQLKQPATGPVIADTALHIARQQEKIGNSMFSQGYITRNPNGDVRPHHYDMNLVFIDQLLTHFNWTGDTNYVREMWPLLERHLAWEKRNYDVDGDGLYDAYACIWASDGLQYMGGGVAHSSAYNYRSNKLVAGLAKLIGKDGSQYEAEANKILAAMNEKLWLKDKGWFAEYIDKMGLQLQHPNAGLWTVYHTIDSDVPTTEQRHQLLRYIDKHIPHIPVQVKELPNEKFYLLATTNWQPYTWSVNNVALAENLHTALSYWQGGENNNAFNLWKSALMESMYLGSSPGNFQQLSSFDAVRGELYRDFADPIGMAARTLVEGLFGVKPDLLNNKLVINPGFPSQWPYANLNTTYLQFDYKQKANTAVYTIQPNFVKSLQLTLQLPAQKEKVVTVKVNGKASNWKWINHNEAIEIEAGIAKVYTIEVEWSGSTTQPDTKAVPVKTNYDATLFNNTITTGSVFETINLQPYFNDKVTQIFKNKYMSPRPVTPTLMIPWQGIGNWCYPLTEANIDDSGLRNLAGNSNKIVFNNVPYQTPGNVNSNNIVYTSRWDNYPSAIAVPVSGKAKQLNLLMAGSTNHQQSHMINAKVLVLYTDGTTDSLNLVNPVNWWPIEQDYNEDGLAYTTGGPRPYRLILKTGEITNNFNNYTSINGFSTKAIDGGAATFLQLPLNNNKTLQQITLITLTNEVVVGLMAATLVRN